MEFSWLIIDECTPEAAVTAETIIEEVSGILFA